MPKTHDGQAQQSYRDDALTWYVVASKPRREADAAWYLKREGFAVFLPRHWETWSRNRHVTTELRPIFPGYLFATVDRDKGQSVYGINTTDGVQSVVMFGGRPATITPFDMWALRRYCDPDGVMPPGPRSHQHLTKIIRKKIAPKMPGLNVQDIIARLERIDDSGRFRLQTALTVELR